MFSKYFLFLILFPLISPNTYVDIHPKTCDHTEICASDSLTYNSLEDVNCISTCTKNPYLKITNYGPCDPPCTCPINFTPVCANDGTTYHNLCSLNCASKKDHRIQLADSKACNETCIKHTRRIYKPVCGDDGITYFNEDIFKCISGGIGVNPGSCISEIDEEEDVYVKYKGEDPCIKAVEFDPVCGSDGVSYVNKGRLECRRNHGKPNLDIDYYGTCLVPRHELYH